MAEQDSLTPPDEIDAFDVENPVNDPAQDADDADPTAPMKPAWPVEDQTAVENEPPSKPNDPAGKKLTEPSDTQGG